jgi:hypothetical protein
MSGFLPRVVCCQAGLRTVSPGPLITTFPQPPLSHKVLYCWAELCFFPSLFNALSYTPQFGCLPARGAQNGSGVILNEQKPA